MGSSRREFLAVIAGAAALPVLETRAAGLPVLETGPETTSESATVVTALQLASDPRRPQYHLLPARNWMNDPNGPIFWNDQYHMFYQYNPDGAYWGNMHWGHAISSDMVHWRHLPVALAPTPGGPDTDGCFTGTAAIQDGRVTILYTGVRTVTLDEATDKNPTPPLRETQCLAVAQDADLIAWEKVAVPVMDTPPPSMEVNGFRDPSPWRQGEWWYTVVGSGIASQGGAVLLYRSRDLRHWEFMHVLSQRDLVGCASYDPFYPWDVWDCPEFFPLGDWHVLIFNGSGRTFWQCGKLIERNMVFRAEQSGIMDYGAFLSAKSQLDRAGNRILWGWIPESRPEAEYKAAGWAGMMSLPRVLSVTANGQVRFHVAAEVNQLRSSEQVLKVSGSDEEIRERVEAIRVADCCGEILLQARRGREPFELILRGAVADVLPWFALKYDPAHPREFRVDGRALPLELEREEDLNIHLYVDGSAIELFISNQAAWVKRFYYEGDHAQELRLRWIGATAGIVSLRAWEFNAISRDRLTT